MAAAGELARRHRHAPRQPPIEAAAAAVNAHAVCQAHRRRRPANDAHEDVVATTAKPTIAGPSLPRSEPFITTATTSTFQICRGRKPTLITVAARGESSSPVINNFNSIPLRSWPISDLNRVIAVHHAGHRPINASCRPLSRSPAARHTHRPSQRTHVPSTTPTPAARVRHHPATFADDAFTASALLARCQLPTILHFGKVGVGVTRPQRTTMMPTSHAAAATVIA
ncbi:hypothetical protein ACLOJK_015170 [Asimina triloba]